MRSNESLADAHHELIIGTYTERTPHVDGGAQGILSCRLDGTTLGPLRLLAPAANPSYLALTADGGRLYAVHETGAFDGVPGGGVSAFARDPASGELTLLNSLPSGGGGPCHLALAPGGRSLLVANYGTGSVAAFELERDGSLGPMTGYVQHEGSGAHPERQTGPHAHMVGFDPHTGEVLVSDLGLDAVMVYRLGEGGELAERPELRVEMAPGAGPRHLAFHPDGHRLFIVNELGNTLVALRREGERFVPTATKSTLPENSSAPSHAAAVRVSPSGRWVLVSNRGADGGSMAVFRFGPSDGSLELAQVQATAGLGPRELVFGPGGRFVVVANQHSHSLVVFAFDERSGQLEQVASAQVPTPACVAVI